MRLPNSLLILLLLLFMGSCKNQQKKPHKNTPAIHEAEPPAKSVKQLETTTYTAQLSALNAKVTGTNTHGRAKFVIANDTMTVTIAIKDAPANMEHWQHFHGFVNGQTAQCPTAKADKNGDGIIDVVETEAMSGTTMVPFNKLPAAMKVGANTYPKADAEGNYLYKAKIPMDKLNQAFAEAFNGDALDLGKRTLYIHGVPKDTKLPETVTSIADIPAQITIPIACGKIIKR